MAAAVAASSPPQPLPPPQPPPVLVGDGLAPGPPGGSALPENGLSADGHGQDLLAVDSKRLAGNGPGSSGADSEGLPNGHGESLPEIQGVNAPLGLPQMAKALGTTTEEVQGGMPLGALRPWPGSSAPSGLSLTTPKPSLPSSAKQSVADNASVLVKGKKAEVSEGSLGPTAQAPSSSAVRYLKRRSDGVDNVVIGTPIRHDHANYVLMYDMLTGIRIAVSRCTAKPWRALEPEDFTAAHKLAFDITGDELTPSSKYDFKFKDYAPWVFRAIRDVSRIDPADYLVSLTGKYVLSELGSPGKSGSFFYFSADYRFIIKTIHHNEHKLLRQILANYHEHLVLNPQTLINRIFGLHRVKLPRGRKIHFVVMANIFPPNKDIHETFDLKGSTYGRKLREEDLRRNPRAVQKDLNWLEAGRKLRLGPEKRTRLLAQLEADIKFLEREKLMDYSLLIGIHNMVRGNQENIRDTTLAVFEPNTQGQNWRGNPSEVRKAVATSDPIALGPSSSKLPEALPEERKHLFFYQDDGGLRATDQANQPLDEIYYLGVIDILTFYSTGKKMENFFKSVTQDSKTISAVNPLMYGKRFLDFVSGCIG
ncbi:hypothetical protein DFJ74DRAFT_673423 [Hyaloraphidium curvatum]|nr:hypothetical protein DFJ74DRAFT_673423 [Hyaloraphidium curvatum]